ncbi:MAG: Lrp/AsnC family transcriptional regulator [Candidatus Freyarchaeota archaeon]|nr:Lrp/AsnC family transcriptional regulator [Candidatus Jordarchaeia archaeon]
MVRISNLKLIEILRENARTPFLRMAEALGVSEAAVRKRVKKLESDGVIKKYTIDVDLRKLGFEVNALIGLDTKPENYLVVLEKLKGMKETASVYATSGDHMILIECWFRNANELIEFCKKLESTCEVTRICPAIILEKVK